MDADTANNASSTDTDTDTERPSRYRGLVYWKKGQSGNPSGRPKRMPVTDLIRDLLATGLAQTLVEELVALGTAKRRVSPGVRLQALMYLANRAEGTPTQVVEVSPGADAAANMLEAYALEAEAAILQLSEPGATPPLTPPSEDA